MKRLMPLLLIAILLPEVALAAWWNPFSWFDNWSFIREDSEKAALEERVEELEERLEKTESTQVASTSEDIVEKESSDTAVPKPTPTLKSITPTQTPIVNVDKTPSLDELIKKYTDFRDYVSSEQSGLTKNSPLYSEKNYYSYLEDLLNRINADLGYLRTIKSWRQLPENIEQTYLSKFNKLETEYKSKVATYAVEREQNLVELKVANQRAEEEAAEQALQYIQDIKVKIAEMDQLRTQIDTLAGSSLMGILNAYRKLDGELLFYAFKYKCSYGYDCTFTYPYESKYYDNNYYISNIRDGLQAIVANYRAFLNVELTKNQ